MKFLNATHNLTFKVTSKIVLIIAVIMVALCLIISTALNNLMTSMAEEKIELLAEENANIATDYLNTLSEKANSLADFVSTLSNINDNASKSLIKNYFTAAMEDERIFGIYLALEPNTYYDDTANGYSFYAYRSETGGLVFENYDYPDYKDGEFYTDPMETRETHITEPYSWTLTNGDVVWLTTISVPLFDQYGNFIGVTTCDVSTDTINDLAYDMGGYETSYSYILTEKGNYVVHSADKQKSGTLYAEEGETETVLNAAYEGERVFFDDINQIYGGDAYKIQVPLNVNGVAEAWSSAFVVSKSEVQKDVSEIIIIVVITCISGIILLILFTAFFLRRSLKPTKNLVGIASDMENGRLSANIQVKTKDELGDLSRIFNRTAETLNGYIFEISEILKEISDGNLTVSVKRDYVGDFEPIKIALTSILCSLNDSFNKINSAAEQVSDNATQVASGAQTLASGATEQASAMEQLFASISQVSNDVQRNADNIHLASDYMRQAGNGVRKSNEYMASLLIAMNGINDSSSKISGIIKIIDDISFQTNILALNAAVEAARAGSAGKGFAVVAEEVRNLASKSAEAAKQTAELITNSITEIKEGTRLAQSTADALTQVEEKTILVETTNVEISEASKAQAVAISEVKQGLQQVSVVIQTITATAEENAAASEELSAQSKILFEEAIRYKTKNQIAQDEGGVH